MKKYMLTIFAPGNSYDGQISLESDEPFPAIHVGDLLNTRNWYNPDEQGRLYRAVNVEHVITCVTDNTYFAVNIYTEAVEDTAEARTRQA